MDNVLYQHRYEELVKGAEKALRELTPAATTRPQRLHSAIRYSLDAGGKRLRPVLCLATAQAFQPYADALHAAVALECIHSYSLIHDDLPCMDDSDLRRGHPSCHKAFDEATALLAGDALIPMAFQLIADGYAKKPAIVQALVAELSRAAGSQLLVGGQAEDMNGNTPGDAADRLDFILRGKTAALISAPFVMGAIIGGASDEDIKRCRNAGIATGVAFQLVDDLLDVTGNAAELGKPVGADVKNKKLTFNGLHGIEATRRRIEELTQSALSELKACNAQTDFLCTLISKMAQRSR